MEKIKVLLVEDEPTLAMIIKDTLDGNEFDITLAANGEEGLSRYAEIDPDIIVADIMMPKMDGFTMVKLIRKTDTHTPVLFLSARSAANDVVEGFETGGNDYLKKPFGMAELIVRDQGVTALRCPSKDRKPPSFRIRALYVRVPSRRHWSTGERNNSSATGNPTILKRLCDNKDQVLPMKEILIDLWGDDSFFNARSLHVFITKLRR